MRPLGFVACRVSRNNERLAAVRSRPPPIAVVKRPSKLARRYDITEPVAWASAMKTALQRQSDREAGTHCRLVEPYRALMGLEESHDDAEAEPGSPALSPGGEEWLEDPCPIGGRYADAVVAQCDLCPSRSLTDDDGHHGRFMPESIVEEVREDDAERLAGDGQPRLASRSGLNPADDPLDKPASLFRRTEPPLSAIIRAKTELRSRRRQGHPSLRPATTAATMRTAPTSMMTVGTSPNTM